MLICKGIVFLDGKGRDHIETEAGDINEDTGGDGKALFLGILKNISQVCKFTIGVFEVDVITISHKREFHVFCDVISRSECLQMSATTESNVFGDHEKRLLFRIVTSASVVEVIVEMTCVLVRAEEMLENLFLQRTNF